MSMDERRGLTDEERAQQEAASEHQQSGGGARYQKAHRQNVVERDGPTGSRAARGTGPDHAARAPAGTDTRPEHRDGAPTSPGLSTNEQPTDEPRVQPSPDDESWLNDLGYPKSGEHVESHATQIEHGPNAGGTQQGDPDAAHAGPSRSSERSS
jgi:hypothetical protein